MSAHILVPGAALKKRYVVLDRDGTVIEERNYLSNPEEVKLIDGAAAALRELIRDGYGLAIITNQSGVGRGFFDETTVNEIHHKLTELLAAEEVTIDGFYVCPHRPEDNCLCRKPALGLLEQAVRELRFDPRASIVIGDKASDIQMGRRAGATTFLVRTGYGSQFAPQESLGADYVVDDLRAAVEMIRNLRAQKVFQNK
jgi:D-glycero-D-manno-heptose 1,7-bisphosphate phosphatase